MTVLDQKTPRTHRCDTCGVVAPWGPGWRWPTPLVGRQYLDVSVMQTFCSEACEGKWRVVE